VKEDEIAQIRAEAMRVNKLREQTAKKIKQLEDSKVEVGGWVHVGALRRRLSEK
jgi:phosphoribosylaminoimidazole-succinocarboxamide synthase